MLEHHKRQVLAFYCYFHFKGHVRSMNEKYLVRVMIATISNTTRLYQY
jgi:hypothetical protein